MSRPLSIVTKNVVGKTHSAAARRTLALTVARVLALSKELLVSHHRLVRVADGSERHIIFIIGYADHLPRQLPDPFVAFIQPSFKHWRDSLGNGFAIGPFCHGTSTRLSTTSRHAYENALMYLECVKQHLLCIAR